MITVDWVANSGRRRIQILLVMFRLAQYLRRGRSRSAARLANGVYRLVAQSFYGIDLPVQTQVGPRLRIHHGVGLVVNGRCRIGSDVELRQGVTIGSRKSNVDCPVIGDGVVIGASALVLGGVHIGSGATIGAAALVLTDVPQGMVATGNPAKVREPNG